MIRETLSRIASWCSDNSVIVTVTATFIVGIFTIYVIWQIGVMQSEIMDQQTEILDRQAEIMNKQVEYMSREGLVIMDYYPQKRISTSIEKQFDLPIILQNIGETSILIIDAELIFPIDGGYPIKISAFCDNVFPIEIKSLSMIQIMLPVNPLANPRVRSSLNQSLIQKLTANEMTVELKLLTPDPKFAPQSLYFRIRILPL